MLRIWTDGCCLKNPGGAGGWAFVVERNGEVLYSASGHVPKTTNNRMELMAVIEALRYPKEPRYIEVVSDSTYVVKGITVWMPRWKEQGWARNRNGRGKLSNARLWQDIDALVEVYAKVRFRWVKGHAGGYFNEMADRLAKEAAECVR